MIDFLAPHLDWFTDPTSWVALITLIVLEIVLGIDNLIFISILTNKLPEAQRVPARRIGIGTALLLRLLLLATVSVIVQLKAPIFALAGHDFSWRDLILIGGGLFLVWKATREIHHSVDPAEQAEAAHVRILKVSLTGAILQILLLDLVFSIDSIVTAVGMTDDNLDGGTDEEVQRSNAASVASETWCSMPSASASAASAGTPTARSSSTTSLCLAFTRWAISSPRGVRNTLR